METTAIFGCIVAAILTFPQLTFDEDLSAFWFLFHFIFISDA